MLDRLLDAIQKNQVPGEQMTVIMSEALSNEVNQEASDRDPMERGGYRKVQVRMIAGCRVVVNPYYYHSRYEIVVNRLQNEAI